MERDERKIIKEQREDGLMVYRYSDFNEEIDDNTFSDSEIGWRFTLIMERFKLYLDTLEVSDESIRIGIVLGAVIKEAESELDDIADFINKSLGSIGILYKEDCRYNNFQNRTVAGLIFHPSSEQSKP